MDGDLGNRAMHFLTKFGRMKNIINRINFNDFHMKFTIDRDYYESNIFQALDAGKNIVIPTMSAGYANQIYSDIADKYPHLKLALYTSSSGGQEKVKLKNVDEHWSDVNVLIYSPTISAGVSFDKIHVDIIFGAICSNSCSERDYHQMLRRVRKINQKDILIFNYSNFTLNPECSYTTYKESKAHCLAIKDINLKRAYVKDDQNRTKIAYTMDDYDENYIYNKAEDMNSSFDCFLTTFISRAIKKGFTYEFILDTNTLDHERKNMTARLNWRIEELLHARDIDHSEAMVLQQKTHKLEDSKDDKLALDKYFIKRELGVDKLDDDILERYHYKYSRITNFTCLIDKSNIPKTHDNQTDELLFKLPIIQGLLKELGFQHVFDNKTRYTKDEIIAKINKLKGSNIFTDAKVYHKVFGSSSSKLTKLFDEHSSLKAKLGFINSVLCAFGIVLMTTRVQEQKGKKTSYYSLGHLDHIAEILMMRSKKGNLFEDSTSIFKQPEQLVFQHLIIEEQQSQNVVGISA